MTSVGMAATVPCLKEIADRAGVSYEEIIYLGFDELKDVFNKKSMIEKIRKRQKAWGCVIENDKIIWIWDPEGIRKLIEKGLIIK